LAEAMPSSAGTETLPKHIAIIMDGNGRWAKQHGLTRAQGHEAGAKSVRVTVEGCREMGIEVLTLYAFSTENWRRSRVEVNALFRLLSRYVKQELENIHQEDIRVLMMGRMDGLPTKVARDMEDSMERTANNRSMTLNVAINYGARSEIADAARAIAVEVQQGDLGLDDIDESCLAQHLYQPMLPDPDLLIRTSGEMRMSNFMLWQLSYTEIVMMKTLWPDFRKSHLRKSIAEYQQGQRRFGGR